MKRKSIWRKKANKLTLAEALLATCEITAICAAIGGICELTGNQIAANKKKREDEREKELERLLDEREVQIVENIETIWKNDWKSNTGKKYSRKCEY